MELAVLLVIMVLFPAVRAELLLITQMHFGCLLELYNMGRIQPPLADEDKTKTETKRPRSRPPSARMAYQSMMDTYRTQH